MASIDKVNDIAPRRQYVALAGQTAFDYPFPIFNASDIVVDVDGVTKALNVDYTVSGAGNDTGGTVTFASPLAGGEVVTLYRDIAIARDTDFQQNGPFRADALNDELDKAFLILQQLKASYNRALRIPVTASATDAQMELAPLDNWLGKYVTINAQGVPEPADLVPGTISQSVIGQLLYPQTAAEVAAGVTPANYAYQPGDPRRYGAIGDRIVDNTAAIQRAIDSAGPNGVVLIKDGEYRVAGTLTLKPQLIIRGDSASIVHDDENVDLFAYTVGTPAGFPGRITIRDLRLVGPGTGGTGVAIHIDANCPFVLVKNCQINDFARAIVLRDAYCSKIEDTSITNVVVGIDIYREAHATKLVNVLVDFASEIALAVNWGGGAGTGPIHNVQVIGGAFQNSKFGVWLEQAVEFHATNVYHEGNTALDYRIGVGDAGAYERSCLNVVLDHIMSTSPVADSGKNIVVEHSVGVELRSMAWDSGGPTTTPHVEVDGYSDKVLVDYQRINSSSPFSFDDPSRVVVRRWGRMLYGSGTIDAIQFGSMGSILGAIWHAGEGGRDAVNLKSEQDMRCRLGGLFKLQDVNGDDVMVIDAGSGALPTSAPPGGSKQLWVDPADSYRVKFQP